MPDRHDTPPLRGDEADLFRRHHDHLVRLVSGRVSAPREVVEDACSFAWLQLLRYQPQRGDQLVAWLRVVAERRAWVLMRGERCAMRASDLPEPGHEHEAQEALEAAGAAIEPDLAAMLDDRATLALLRQLKPQQRVCLLLRGQGCTYEQIQQATGKTYTWVNRHVTEGKRALRQLIEQGGGR